MTLAARPFVSREEYQAQWDAGWPDFHPETYCQRCLCRNIKSWYVDSPLWNQTELRSTEIVCPQCFTELHAEATGDWQTWELRPAQRSADDLRASVLNILIGNPHASQDYLAHRIAIEVADRVREADEATVEKVWWCEEHGVSVYLNLNTACCWKGWDIWTSSQGETDPGCRLVKKLLLAAITEGEE